MSAENHMRRYLTEYMARHGMTVTELATELGMGHASVYKWLSGRGGATLATLERMKETLGATWDELLGQ